ncbi:hypothetical protein BDV23DRAFT_142753 [Aspergillus alliaceus]|uniref:Uncharacterized protein n=1 Tax=Petromyces alliaceus TaxID=209559 RepID=A0A5N7CQ80_PETAA|nr:hypothetical protein BDV23DRAFT_142753 [Aspergillus alliaceus]
MIKIGRLRTMIAFQLPPFLTTGNAMDIKYCFWIMIHPRSRPCFFTFWSDFLLIFFCLYMLQDHERWSVLLNRNHGTMTIGSMEQS